MSDETTVCCFKSDIIISDAHIERQELWKNVFPTVRLYAQSLGLHLHLIDPYHMIDCNPTIPFIFENKEIYRLNLKEICTSQELSAGSSFMVSIQIYNYNYKYIPH